MINNMARQDAFKRLIPSKTLPVVQKASFSAPINIALIKYWGKRDKALNLPQTDSLSLALSRFTTTEISKAGHSATADLIFLNDKSVESSDPFFIKLVEFLSHVRPTADFFFDVRTKNDVPTGSGLASSASGFAALVGALNGFFGWDLSLQKLSSLARLGSGSASRSLYHGLVRWNKGESMTGEDSYAVPLPFKIPNLMCGILLVSDREKEISSREAMARTVETSTLYAAWPETVKEHIKKLEELLSSPEIDFFKFGSIVEQNALSMHATMAAAFPPIIYWKPETLLLMKKVFHLREKGLPIFLTMDAGPNIKLLFQANHLEEVLKTFPDVQLVDPLWA